MLKLKLRTHAQIKHNYETELNVKTNLPRNQRSFIAQLRMGILPLALEFGRLKNIPEEQRLCDLKEVENESRFFLILSLL